MTQKVYRTAQGRVVDLGALQLKNENIRSVGNMGVNSRGDLLDANNRPIDTRNNQVNKQYRRQVTNVIDEPAVQSSPRHKAPVAKTVEVVNIPPPPEDFDDDFVKVPDPVTTPTSEPSAGLAAAIARAREIKQEPVTPLNAKKGVTRI